MKRKAVAGVLGGTLMTALLCSTSVQAATYSYDFSGDRGGIISWTVTEPSDQEKEELAGDITKSISDDERSEVKRSSEAGWAAEQKNAEQEQSVEEADIAVESGMEQSIEEDQKKKEEYEEFGISYNDDKGGWLWEGEEVFLLLDEDGSLYQNGSKEAKAKKIYLAVERKNDGEIDEVKQIAIEDTLQKMADH